MVVQLIETSATEEERAQAIDPWYAREQEISDRRPETDVRLAWRLAEMKWAASLRDAAWNDFYDAIDLAGSFGFDDVVQRIKQRMQELDSGAGQPFTGTLL